MAQGEEQKAEDLRLQQAAGDVGQFPRAGAIDLHPNRRVMPFRPAERAQDQTPFSITQGDFDNLLKRLKRQSRFTQVPFTAGLTVTQLRPEEERTYFLIQNLNAVGIIYVGFGFQPTINTGFQIPAGGVYEPFQVPSNEIFILGSAASVVGTLIYATN